MWLMMSAETKQVHLCSLTITTLVSMNVVIDVFYLTELAAACSKSQSTPPECVLVSPSPTVSSSPVSSK